MDIAEENGIQLVEDEEVQDDEEIIVPEDEVTELAGGTGSGKGTGSGTGATKPEPALSFTKADGKCMSAADVTKPATVSGAASTDKTLT